MPAAVNNIAYESILCTFNALVILIAVYELWRKWPRNFTSFASMNLPLRYYLATMMTTIVTMVFGSADAILYFEHEAVATFPHRVVGNIGTVAYTFGTWLVVFASFHRFCRIQSISSTSNWVYLIRFVQIIITLLGFVAGGTLLVEMLVAFSLNDVMFKSAIASRVYDYGAIGFTSVALLLDMILSLIMVTTVYRTANIGYTVEKRHVVFRTLLTRLTVQLVAIFGIDAFACTIYVFGIDPLGWYPATITQFHQIVSLRLLETLRDGVVNVKHIAAEMRIDASLDASTRDDPVEARKSNLSSYKSIQSEGSD